MVICLEEHKDLKQGLAIYGWHFNSGPQVVCVNKVLLEHSHAHSFMFPLWLHLLHL
jgi:hypothetical protein